MTFFGKRNFSLIIIGLVVVFALGLSLFYQSRAFFLGIIFASIVLWFSYARVAKTLKWSVLVLFLMLAMTLIFYIKSDSSSGRLLIYKISLQMWRGNWLAGIGWGNFKSLYMHYQARYFEAGIYSEKELLLADNTYYAFNEYLQLVIEAGLLGFFAMVAYLYFLYKLVVKTIVRFDFFTPINILLGFVIAVHIAALFTYCFHKSYICSLYLASVATLLIYCFKKKPSIYNSLLLLIVVFLFCFIGINYQFRYSKCLALNNLDEVKHKEGTGDLYGASRLLKEIEPSLYNDGDFMELKSRLCYAVWDLNTAEQATLQLIKLRPSNLAYARLGNIYRAKENIELAEKAYIMAINMVPNRFIERYRLYQFYKEIGEEEKANKIKEDILRLPVKIPSDMINRIKNNIQHEQ